MNLNKNNQKKLRKFHLPDLPKKRLYLILNKSFRDKFFKKLYQLIGGSTILGRKLSVIDETIRRWKVGLRAIPNWALLDLNDLLSSKKFSIQEIEKNIIAYRGESSKKLITKLNLPIVEDERLIRIVTHLICDGYDGGEKHLPTYNNTEKILIKNFIDDLPVFGNVPVRLRKDIQSKGRKLLYRVEFPRIFTHILRELYKIKFDGNNARLPKYFFNLHTDLVFQVIRASFDDEGYVAESKVGIGLSNFNLLNDFKKLIELNLKEFKDCISNIICKYSLASYSRRPQYRFEINRKALNFYNKHIGFKHPRKKRLLNLIISRRTKPGNKYPEGIAKRKIFELLSKNPSSPTDLALKLGIKPKNIRYHLENLKKEDKIIISHKGWRNAFIWRIK